jgi:hypothetical protein
VKFSLISATSIIALFSAALGPAHAGSVSATPGQTSIYDLVHDGMTSSDGGDGTVALQDLTVSATQALEATSGGWGTAGFTGKVDELVAAGNAYPAVPLGAAPGTHAIDDLVAPVVIASQNMDALRKARAIGTERMASLIGTIGGGPAAPDTKAGSTVFVSAGSPVGFTDGGDMDGGHRASSVAFAFAPSSSSTATITVAGAGNLSRQKFAGGLSVIAANSLQATPAAIVDTAPSVAMSDAARPTLGYNYAPVPTAAVNPAAKTSTVAAVFSDVVTASGAQVADRVVPATIQTSQVQSGTGKIQTSQLQPGQAANGSIQTSQIQGGNNKLRTSELLADQAQSVRYQTSEAAVALSKLLDLSQPPTSQHGNTQADGTRAFISASVSVNPTATAVRYMADAVNATPVSTAGQSVEAFQIGPTPGATRTQANAATTVADPLHGKILASAGPLNSNLALP